MSWLVPLGFLGFLGLIVLIIIYIIKPNYQNKIISSTFLWHLSLKLKRKKIPVNTLRNILLFICQVLVITMATLILARPVIAGERKEELREKIGFTFWEKLDENTSVIRLVTSFMTTDEQIDELLSVM